MVLPKIDLNVRRLDREISLKEVDSIRDYLNINCIDVAYSKMPSRIRRIGPTKAPLYTRTYSITFTEPEQEKKDSEKLTRYESAINSIGRFEDHVESLSGTERQCGEAFRETYRHNGIRLADHIKNTQTDIDALEDERARLARLVADLVLFRGTTTAGTYGMFEGPLGNIDVNVGGVDMKGRDLALAASSIAFGVTSGLSYVWTRKKAKDFRRKLRDNIEMVYRQAILEAVDDLYMYYPEAVIQITPQAGKMLSEIRKAKAYRVA